MNRLKYLAVLAVAFFAACDKKNDDQKTEVPDETLPYQYIITARQSSANIEGPSYLLQTDQIHEGTINMMQKGWQADQNGGTADGSIWFYPSNKAAYHFAYRRGPSDITSYFLDAKSNLQRGTIEYQIEEGQGTFGVWNGKLVTITGHVQNNKAYTDVHFFDPVSRKITTESKATEEITGQPETENVYFAGVIAKGDKFYASVVGSEDHEVNDRVRIIEFDENLNTRMIDDPRISYSGGRFRSILFSQLDVDTKGDIYVFSSSFEPEATQASGVLRIKNRQSDFDPDYYVNFDELTEGRSVYKVWYIKDDLFLVQTYTETSKNQADPDMKRLAIFNLTTKSIKWVSGIPLSEDITRIANAPLIEDGKIILPITTSKDYPYVYTIDPSTARATRGLKIIAGSVVAIGKIEK